jgi:hypothetical protein
MMRAFYLLQRWPPRAGSDRLTLETLFKGDDEETLRPIRPGAFARWAAEHAAADRGRVADRQPATRRPALSEGS